MNSERKSVKFEVWVAVGPDGYKACLGSGISQATAIRIADEVHFPNGCYTLVLIVKEVELPEPGQMKVMTD